MFPTAIDTIPRVGPDDPREGRGERIELDRLWPLPHNEQHRQPWIFKASIVVLIQYQMWTFSMTRMLSHRTGTQTVRLGCVCSTFLIFVVALHTALQLRTGVHRLCTSQHKTRVNPDTAICDLLVSPFDQRLDTVIIMYPKYLCHLGCLSAFLLPLLYALSSVPSNSSIMQTGLGNHTLSAWPPHTGWKMHIGDLTLVFKEYGDFAPETHWRGIRESFIDFRRRFLYGEGNRLPPPHSQTYWYDSGEVQLKFVRSNPSSASSPNYLSGKEVTQVFSTINGLFFDPGEKPRELSVDIMKSHVDPTSMSISWRNLHNPWPQERFSIQAAPNLVMDVYMYGRDFYPNKSFNARVSDDMNAIYQEISRETDDSRKPIRKSAYISGIVMLTIDPPAEAGQALIKAWETIVILKNMKNLIFNYRYGPREFGTCIRDRGKALAKVSLLIDPDGFDDQSVLTLPSPNW